jgi:single-strand DNA-binding protein
MINKVILIGNLGRDPEVRRLENGAVVAKFSLATNETYKDKNGERQTQTEWHDVVVWRQTAEFAEKYLTKGMLVYIEGKLTHRKYQDKEGKDRYITEVYGLNIRLLDRKEGSGSGFKQNMPTEEPATTTSKAKESASVAENAGDKAEDDLPF